MTEESSKRQEEAGPAGSLPPYEPPAFVPPPGPGIPPPPPLYNQGQYGLFSQDPYSQPPTPGQDYQFQHSQGPGPGQVGAPYGPEQYGSSPFARSVHSSPYGQPAYFGMQPQSKGLSITSMVCGILAVLMGTLLIPQIAAVITGHMALKREPAGRGMAIAGLVLGYLCLLGYGLILLLIVIGMTLGM